MFFLSYMFVDTALLRAWLFLWMLLRALLLYSKKVRQGGNGLSKKYEANHCGGSIALLIEMFTCARTVSSNGPRIQLVSLTCGR
jgi:hypothetical protein